MKSFSVGVPVKNEENNILDCLNSIYKQSLLPEKVYVCINGSTDSTLKIVEEFKKEKSNLEILFSEKGKMCAIKKILDTTSSELLAIVDGDTKVNEHAFQELYDLLGKGSFLFVGGSSYRKIPEKNFFTKISDSNYGVVDRQRFLNGKMYMFEVSRLMSCLETLGIGEIPYDTISDGHFFEKVSLKFGGFHITEKAISFCNPIDNFGDWIKFRLRISRGRKQLSGRFPFLFDTSDFGNFRLKNYYHRFSVAEGFLKKIGSIIFGISREIINLYVYFESDHRRESSQIESTKKPF